MTVFSGPAMCECLWVYHLGFQMVSVNHHYTFTEFWSYARTVSGQPQKQGSGVVLYLCCLYNEDGMMDMI